MFGGKEVDLDAVAERPFGGAVLCGSGLLDLSGLQGRGVEQLCCNFLALGSGDFGGLHLFDYLENLLLGGSGIALLLGAAVDHYEVLVGDELGNNLVELVHAYLSEEGFHDLLFHGGFEIALLVEEVVQKLTDEFGVLAGCGTLYGCFLPGDDLGLGAIVFLGGEAVALHAFELGVEGAEALEDVVFAEGDLAVCGFNGFINHVGHVETAVEEGSSGLGRDVGETLGHDTVDERLHEVVELADDGGVHFFGLGLALPCHFNGGIGGFGVGEDAYDGLLVGREGNLGLCLGILALGNAAEVFLDLRLDAVGVDVAYNNDSLPVGMIPGSVEVVEALGSEGFEALLAADEGAGGVFGVAEIVGETLLEGAPLRGVALALLAYDDGTLEVDFLSGVGDIMRIFAEDEDAGVGHGGAFHRHVVEHVLRLFETCRGIDVAAEFCAYALEVIKDALSGEALGAVEAHVLEEVGETVLVGSLVNAAGVGGEIEFRPVLRKFVVADIIGEAVLKLADADCGVVRKGLHHGIPLGAEAQGRETRGDEY